MLPVAFDPAIHEIVNTPWAETLKREAQLPGLEVIHNRIAHTWVIALVGADRQWMQELGFADDKDGKSPAPTGRDAETILHKLRKGWVDAKTLIRERKAAREKFYQQRAEENERFLDAQEAMARYLRRTKGSAKADKYLRSTGLAVLDRRKRDIIVGT